MSEGCPDKVSMDAIKSGFEINKVYFEREVVFDTLVNDGSEGINLVHTGAVPPKTTLILAECRLNTSGEAVEHHQLKQFGCSGP